eukprot:CAMPEP_0181322114 /NCGR_PEP_ID=MMETSP1101-20121128/19055_1 /TAXON_ID=46948 /ORGANISM="Rhodomonas abbreviata, Strain Caron Lab Isolate" /LENGTH=220 /DNA_ID=CAMNT_0023430005 /DNA_START=27 /DNA_END=689 /DNA_ORIENTATION=+
MTDVYAAADELYGKGSFQEAIDALGSGEALQRKSRWISEIADDTKDTAEKAKLYRESVEVALASIAADPDNFATHKAAAISKGKLLDHVGINELVQLTKDVKDHIEKSIAIDSSDSAAWHVLGKWHCGVASLNWVTMMALKVVFGGMPDASHEKALECLQKANDIYPNASSVLEKAKVLMLMGRKAEAKAALEGTLGMDTDLPVYRRSIEEAKQLLKDKF